MKEYLCVSRPFIVNREGEDANVTEWLNQQARDGWRLVVVVSFVYYFERIRNAGTKGDYTNLPHRNPEIA